MKIGLDWDGTVNADPTTFREVVCSFLDAGHEVAVVTWRCKPDEEDVWPDMAEIFDDWGFKIPVYHCNGKAKREVYDADIWIDDNPAAVVFTLESEPRFVENPEDYDRDILCLYSKGFDPVRVTWKQLKPQGHHHLVSPVNFAEEGLV